MSTDAPTPWSRLALGAGAAAVIVVVGAVAGIRLQLVPVLGGCLLVVTIWWAASLVRGGSRPAWSPPEPPPEVRFFAADQQTRRAATMIADAAPGRGFATGTLCETLASRTRFRLERGHGLPADAPLGDASHLVSEPLLTYLSHAGQRTAPPITRRTLMRYLEEIEEL